MAEIGEQLREARTRQRIEIAQMEAQTKIRAKYLRALENEEWDLLPGPTYVKSFLRTYGDMLGLDGRLLVADYKRSHEPFASSEDMGQIPKHSKPRNAPSSGGPGIGVIVGAVVAVAAAAALGYTLLTGGDEPADSGATPAASQGPSEVPLPVGTEVVGVLVRATADLSFCARAGTRPLADQQDLAEGERSSELRGRSVVVTLTARRAQVTIDGDRVPLPGEGAGPVTFVATDEGLTEAPAGVTACR